MQDAPTDQPVKTRRPNGRMKPVPPAFAEVFIRNGWRGIEQVYGSRTECNKRWVQECGGERLIAERRAYRKRLSAVKREIGLKRVFEQLMARKRAC